MRFIFVALKLIGGCVILAAALSGNLTEGRDLADFIFGMLAGGLLVDVTHDLSAHKDGP